MVLRTIAARIPHDLRRYLFSLLFPNKYKQIFSLRKKNGDYGLKHFDDTKSLFVHMPKCAGISVNQAFYGCIGAGHASVLWYQLVYSKAEFDSFFKFTFVRNPFDRLLSAFFFLKKGGMSENDKMWADQYISDFEDFDTFVRRWITPRNIMKGIHFTPQHQFLCSWGKNVAVDYIGRVETIEKDFEFIAGKIGTASHLQHNNASSKRKRRYSDFYSNESRAIVEKVYKQDFELFNYNFEGVGSL